MERRFVLLLSGALALLAVVLLQAWKASIARDLGFYGDSESILIAARDLPVGHTIAAGDLAEATYPQRYLPPRYVRGSLLDALVGEILVVTVRAGQPVLDSDRAGSEVSKLSQRIPETLRALALKVDRISTFGGLLTPGDRVDIVVTWKNPEGRLETRTLLQRVAIASVGGALGTAKSPSDRGRGQRIQTVSVVVTPREAEMLIFAEKQGELTLTLRREKDLSTADDLAGVEWFKPAQVEAVQKVRERREENCVTILKAGRKTETICG
jgi:pilus assembly protein CpaB